MANYDLTKLSVSLVDAGFTVGATAIGGNLGIVSTQQIDVSNQLTSIDIEDPRRVDDGLWISEETQTCTVRAIFEDALVLFKGRHLVISYSGQELFSGKVRKSSRSVSVGADGGKRWSVTISATNTRDASTSFNIYPQGGSDLSLLDTLISRVPYIQDVSVSPSVVTRVSTFMMADVHETSSTVGKLYEQVSRIGSCLVQVDPGNATAVHFAGYNDGAVWTLRDDMYPSFSSLSFSESSDAITEVLLKSDISDTPQVRVSVPGLDRNDKALSLDIPPFAARLQEVAESLPVRSFVGEYISSVGLPFHESLDLNRPTEVVVWLDGKKYSAAVLTVRHTIDTNKWSVSLSCGPEHLITRESDPTRFTEVV